jgi:hypothetical protein
MMSAWIAIFKVGRHTDASGQTRDWTRADLDQIVRSYNPQDHEAPVVIGHPASNDPAWAWIEGLRRTGDVLYAKLKDVVPAFGDMVRQGLFKKRSIALYPPKDGHGWRLRHLAFLGAMPPSVKGLEDRLAFAQDASTTFHEVTFEELVVQPQPLMLRVLTSLREFLIDRFGMDAADKVLPTWDLDALRQPPEMSEPTPPKEPDMDKAELDRLLAKAREDGKRAAQAEFAEHEHTAQTRLAQIEAENRRQRLHATLADLKRQGKVLPAWEQAGLLTFLETLETLSATEAPLLLFAEGEPKVSPAQWFQRFLAALPPLVAFGEIACHGHAESPASPGEELAELAYAYMAQHTVSYSEAFLAVQRERPDLAAEYLATMRR